MLHCSVSKVSRATSEFSTCCQLGDSLEVPAQPLAWRLQNALPLSDAFRGEPEERQGGPIIYFGGWVGTFGRCGPGILANSAGGSW